jgi:hypothetical protein
MSLDDLNEDTESEYADLGEELPTSLDRETRNELALLSAALDPEDPDELARRGIHLLFQRLVETGTLDFHLRSGYDLTYDEYLSGMTYEDVEGMNQYPQSQDNPRNYWQ